MAKALHSYRRNIQQGWTQRELSSVLARIRKKLRLAELGHVADAVVPHKDRISIAATVELASDLRSAPSAGRDTT